MIIEFKPYGKCQHHRIMGKTHILKWHDETHITRHIPLRVKTSPYDGNWSYWGTRKGAYIGLDTARGKLLKHQGGRCAHCQLFFAVDDKTEVHHEDGNRKNKWSRMKAPCCLSVVGFLQALPAPDKHVSAHPAVQLWLLHAFSQSTRLPFYRVTTRQPIAVRAGF